MNDFKSVLLTLGDEAFFELVRNYLGPVKTPFNKHDLIGRLESFLRREEIQDQIISLIDEEDAELLSAIWMLGEPDFDELYLLFARKRSYLDMHHRVLNLEDRLLVYRSGERLRLNPILQEPLEGEVLRPDRLFVSRPRKANEQEPTPPWVTDTLLVSLYAYLQERPEVFRADHTLRKRTLNDLASRLPELVRPVRVSPGGGEVVRATVLLDALVAAGAVAEGDGLQPIPEVWERLSGLSTTRRLATLAAARACHPQHETGALPEAIEVVLSVLPQDRALSALSVERLLLVLAPEQSTDTTRRAREMMGLIGLLTVLDDEHVLVAPLPSETTETKPLVVQPNFDLMMPEEFAFADGLFVARFARLTRHDRYPHFELTKGSLAAALREGERFDEIAERLSSLAGGRLPQNVTVTMRQWAAEYESVRLFRGIVLTVEKARRYAVEHSEEIRSLIRRELAPGVYLLHERDVEAVQQALEGAGVELVPELPVVAPPHRSPLDIAGTGAAAATVNRTRLETLRRALEHADAPGADAPGSDEPGGVSGPPADEHENTPGHSGSWRQKIQAGIEDDELTEEQREDLAARVRQKLILSPEQIRPGVLKTEKREARGLDYIGKVRIIEEVVRNGGAFLEIIERSEDGAPQRRLVEPLELSKRDNELYLAGEELPERTPVELRVRKLGLVRRLRAGLVKRKPTHR